MKRFYVVLIVVLAITFLWWWQSHPLPFTVTFFNVGEGDAALVQTPAGQTILIDGGPNANILQKLGRALPWAERTIDLVILSHPHADHVTGLISVLERYRVRQVLATGVVHTTPEYLNFLKLIKEKNIPFLAAQGGQVIQLAGGVEVEVLWPLASYAGMRVDDLNAASMVNKISYGANSVLFMGDTPIENEQAMLKVGINLKSQILKVAHQGSDTSSSEEFIKTVAPEFAVIPVGPNRYGHPSPTVVERLIKLVPVVLRTDQGGDIGFTSDGKKWTQK